MNSVALNSTAQKLCVWAAAVMAVLFFVGFVGFAHFWPPTPPHQSAQSIARFLAAHRNSIRLGLMLMALGAAFLGPFCAVITVQMKRIEGRYTPLAYTQLALGALFVWEFIMPAFVEQALLYRPRNLGDTLLFSDLFWLMYVGVVSTSALQWATIGIAILRDKRKRPVYPRWVGYVNLWLAVLFIPGNFVIFFKTGPLAWNGLLTWYTVVVGFFIWLVVMMWATLRTIDRQQTDDALDGDHAEGQIDPPLGLRLEQMDGELASLRAELARGTTAA
jgi:hypothetical protein